MLDGNGRFNIPKGFKNKQGYDQDEEDDWDQDSHQSAQSSSEHKTNESVDDKKQK